METVKFHNPTKFLVSFNRGIRLADGRVLPKWVNIPGGEDFITEDEAAINQAREHNEVNRALSDLKGYLVEVKETVKAEEVPKVDKPKKLK